MKKINRPFRYVVCFWISIILMICGHNLYANNTIKTRLPNFNLPTLYHPAQQLTNHDLHGRVVLLNFWASWCTPCYEEHSVLMKIKNEHIPIFGINLDENPNNARRMLDKRGNPYERIGMDSDMLTADMFGIHGVPQTFIIDTQGFIRYRYQGKVDERIWVNILRPLIRQIETERQFF